MLGLKKEVFYDLDGSATNVKFGTATRTGAKTVSFGWPHLLQDPACKLDNNQNLWDGTCMCD